MPGTNLVRNRKYRSIPEKRRHHRVLRMRVDTASRVSKIEGIPEKWGARGFLEVHRGTSEKYTVGVR